MNQILYIENKKKKGGPLEIKTILIIFVVCLIVFGGFLIGKSAFAIINKNKEEGISEPVVQVVENGSKLNVKVTHDKLIDKITYSWNDEEETVLQGKGRKEIEETIDIPEGTNVFILKVIDITGKTATYSQEYELTKKDIIEPEIELLEPENQEVKIVAKDETELDYIMYYWNEEDGTKKEAGENSKKQIEEKIDIKKGTNTLTVIAVDKAGNEKKIEQTYKGVKKPQIEVLREGNELIIKVTDEEEIKRIEYTLNGQEYSTDPNNTGASLGVSQVEFRQALAQGENKITIRAYNIGGVEARFEGEAQVQ